MNPVLKNIIAFVVAVIAGFVVNIGLITISPSVIPPPAGVDMTTAEGLNAGMHLLEPRHFIFPFLAHALGTFVGAFVAAFLAASHKMKLALGIGVLTLLGGIAAALMIPAPTWFIVLDLVVAYIPMAWLGGKLATRQAAWRRS